MDVDRDLLCGFVLYLYGVVCGWDCGFFGFQEGVVCKQDERNSVSVTNKQQTLLRLGECLNHQWADSQLERE